MAPCKDDRQDGHNKAAGSSSRELNLNKSDNVVQEISESSLMAFVTTETAANTRVKAAHQNATIKKMFPSQKKAQRYTDPACLC